MCCITEPVGCMLKTYWHAAQLVLCDLTASLHAITQNHVSSISTQNNLIFRRTSSRPSVSSLASN